LAVIVSGSPGLAVSCDVVAVFVVAGLLEAVVHAVREKVSAVIMTRVCFVIRMQDVPLGGKVRSNPAKQLTTASGSLCCYRYWKGPSGTPPLISERS